MALTDSGWFGHTDQLRPFRWACGSQGLEAPETSFRLDIGCLSCKS